MASSFVQLFGYMISMIGLLLTIIICARPNWRVNDLDGEVIESIRRSSGLWSRVSSLPKTVIFLYLTSVAINSNPYSSARTTTLVTGNATSTIPSSLDCLLLFKLPVLASALHWLSKESLVWLLLLEWNAQISSLLTNQLIQVRNRVYYSF